MEFNVRPPYQGKLFKGDNVYRQLDTRRVILSEAKDLTKSL